MSQQNEGIVVAEREVSGETVRAHDSRQAVRYTQEGVQGIPASSFIQVVPNSTVEKFETGATRHSDADKPDYEGFLSPLVIESYGKYMHTHRKQADGSLRDSDNWQKGIPTAKYMKSLWRHLFAAWKLHRGYSVEAELIGGKWATPTLEDCLNGILFNTMGYLHELIKAKDTSPVEEKRANPAKIKEDPRVAELRDILAQLRAESEKQRVNDWNSRRDPIRRPAEWGGLQPKQGYGPPIDEGFYI